MEGSEENGSLTLEKNFSSWDGGERSFVSLEQQNTPLPKSGNL
jgi:hypothetical protein